MGARLAAVGSFTALVLAVGPSALPVAAVQSTAPIIELSARAGSAVDGVIYTETGFDPVGDEGAIAKYDIGRSARTLLRKDGIRYLRLTVRAAVDYEVSDYLGVFVRLDTQRGPRVDYTMELYVADMSGSGCLVGRGGGFDHPPVKAKTGGLKNGALTCRVPARDLHLDKRVRWRVVTGGQHHRIDRAPDGGAWYG